jgi:hypothetical protein
MGLFPPRTIPPRNGTSRQFEWIEPRHEESVKAVFGYAVHGGEGFRHVHGNGCETLPEGQITARRSECIAPSVASFHESLASPNGHPERRNDVTEAHATFGPFEKSSKDEVGIIRSLSLLSLSPIPDSGNSGQFQTRVCAAGRPPDGHRMHQLEIGESYETTSHDSFSPHAGSNCCVRECAELAHR